MKIELSRRIHDLLHRVPPGVVGIRYGEYVIPQVLLENSQPYEADLKNRVYTIFEPKLSAQGESSVPYWQLVQWNTAFNLCLTASQLQSFGTFMDLFSKSEYIALSSTRTNSQEVLPVIGTQYRDKEGLTFLGCVEMDPIAYRFLIYNPDNEEDSLSFIVPPRQLKNPEDIDYCLFPYLQPKQSHLSTNSPHGPIYFTTREVHEIEMAYIKVNEVFWFGRTLPVFARTFNIPKRYKQYVPEPLKESFKYALQRT